MKTDLYWLSVSIFCDIENWHLLLKKGIRGFIFGLGKKSFLRYQISLNYKNGSNIRLSLLTTKEKEEYLINKINVFFSDFFLTIPKKNIEISEDQVFMSFPSNTVQFGLYELACNISLLETTYKVKEQITNVIIQALSEESIDYEAIIAFAYYLHVSLIKVCSDSNKGEINYLLNLYQKDITIVDQQIDTELLYQYFKNNNTLLNEIINEVYFDNDNESEGTDIKWLNNWSDLCKNELKLQIFQEYSDNKIYEKAKEIQFELASLINSHLSIIGESESYLYFMISQSLANFFNLKVSDRYSIYVENKKKMILDHLKVVEKTKSICTKIDINVIPDGKNEIRLFVIARNESLRLPYFLQYYSNLGVDRFFLIDNNSTDNTRNIALEYKNVHVFKIDEGYKDHWNWMEYFLNKYGKNRWCLVVDVDELLHYPHSESITLKQLISYFDLNKYTALRSVLLDVYSEKSIRNTKYKQNENPLKTCPFFDPDFIKETHRFLDKKKWSCFDSIIYYGGVRTRVFKNNKDNNWLFCISKISLFKYLPVTYLVYGMHAINGASISDIEGAVIHSKFLSDFIPRVKVESGREEHYQNAIEYKIYCNTIEKNQNVILKNEKSVKYSNTKQLIELRIMKISDKYKDFLTSFISTRN